jgi:hypothetical protein
MPIAAGLLLATVLAAAPHQSATPTSVTRPPPQPASQQVETTNLAPPTDRPHHVGLGGFGGPGGGASFRYFFND